MTQPDAPPEVLTMADGTALSLFFPDTMRALLAAAYQAGRRDAAATIRNAGGAYPDVLRQCANLAEHGDVNDREPA